MFLRILFPGKFIYLFKKIFYSFDAIVNGIVFLISFLKKYLFI